MTEKTDMQSSARIKLLLVDDEEGFVNVIANRMSKRGIDATKAISGSDALKAIRKQDFDVAVVDLKMQEMDGIELLRILKKIIPEMPVIVLTGHGSERAAEDGMEYGAFDYLTKPCEMDELMEKIHEALARGR